MLVLFPCRQSTSEPFHQPKPWMWERLQSSHAMLQVIQCTSSAGGRTWFLCFHPGGSPVCLEKNCALAPVEREDKGMYQCFVYNDKESAQDAAQLLLGDVAPVLKHAFEPAKVEPGSALSLKCIASGNPLPQVTWTLDDLAIPDHMRFSVGDYVTSKAEVVSFVNISTLRVEDGVCIILLLLKEKSLNEP
ncbi:dscam13 [Caerostris extrusa]|uniref:Dscam13 n=1 Tax=Caerostris extrusa TaxID=172846 RepID=A0AAV4XKT9_CAEEX|nr:dscam13 [Caerostris extrusa]